MPAVEAANDAGFGPGGSEWGTGVDRLDRAVAVTDRLECGTAWVNHHPELALAQSFAGVEQSEVGGTAGCGGFTGTSGRSPFTVHCAQEA